MSGVNSYRTGSDTEEATTTDNPTTPFPTPPPTCASPTMYHHPLSSNPLQQSPNLSSSGVGTGGHRQASPYPLESTNLSGNSTPVNSTSPRFPTHMSSSSSRHHHGGHHHHYPTKKSSLSRSDVSVGSKQSAGQQYGQAGSSATLGSRGRVSASSRRMAAQQQQQGGAAMTSSSSTSSASSATDNNSDMTYPGVEMLSGVKDGRRLHLENGKCRVIY